MRNIRNFNSELRSDFGWDIHSTGRRTTPNSAKLMRLVKLRKFLPVFDSVFIYFSIKKMVLIDCLSLQFAIAYKQFVRTIDQYC